MIFDIFKPNYRTGFLPELVPLISSHFLQDTSPYLKKNIVKLEVKMKVLVNYMLESTWKNIQVF